MFPQSEYPDEYAAHSAPSGSRDDSSYQPQWEQPQDSQPSQHSQVSDQLSQPGFEQTLEQTQQQAQPLSLPPAPPQQSLYQQQLQDPQHLVPSQIPPRGTHDPAPVRLHHPGSQRSPPVEIQPVMLQSRTTVPASRAHPHRHHPYPRPSSASGRREIEGHQHIHFASHGNTPQSNPVSAMQSPAATRPTFTLPMSEYGPPHQQSVSPSFASSSPGGAPFEGAFVPFVPLGPPQETPVANERRYIIRADTYYDPRTRVLTAMLELPGMKKRDLRITLTTTLFNRVRQVTVNGQSRAPFPPLTSQRRSPRAQVRSLYAHVPCSCRYQSVFPSRGSVISDPFFFRVPTSAPFSVASQKISMRRWRMGY
ncbi:hypothetical protein MVEN_01069600 [Mycena venus]|uniref:SHSP domain-containing protein n=1 Tax=Mycena venus TaxID=2733690 RepID=A0A8H6Y942_9AGAR|nr:hypothetical protein MVEN_01069600 [Mycena venus]